MAVLHIGEQRERAADEDRQTVGRLLPTPAGNEVEDELGDVGVVADNDEHRWRVAGLRHTSLFPALECALVVAIETPQGPLELGWEHGRPLERDVPPTLPGELVANLSPQLQVGHGGSDPVVADRHARNLHDAGLNRVDEREVADHPRKQRALGIPGPRKEERCGREIVDGLDAKLPPDVLQPGEPHSRLGVPRLGLSLVLALEGLFGVGALVAISFAAIAVVSLVVQNDDLPPAGAELSTDAGDHLIGRLLEWAWRVGGAGEKLLGQSGDSSALFGLAQLEGMKVGDDDPRLVERAVQVGRHEVAQPVVVVRMLGKQDPQPITDGDAWRDDEEVFGEASVLRAGDLVQGVPGDEHCHDHGLARAGGHFERDSGEGVVVLGVGGLEFVADPGVSGLGCRLRQVDGSLGGLPLAEQDRVVALRGVPEVQQGTSGGCHIGVATTAPKLHLAPDLIDLVVFSDPVQRPLRREFKLPGALLAGPGNRDEVGAAAAALGDLVGDAVVVKDEVTVRLLIRRVEDRILDDPIWHGLFIPPAGEQIADAL